MKKYDAIIFDFDGVILDSLKIKEQGFRDIFAEFPKSQVEGLLNYHRLHGGISRFVKIKYFFEEIRKEVVPPEEERKYAENFSKIMKESLINKNYLILEILDLIKKLNFKKIPCHIASGTEDRELKFLAEALGIKDYFKTIEGSPTPKEKLVRGILKNHDYDNSRCILIGDSMTDYEAAKANRIEFCGYGNSEIEKLGQQKLIKELLGEK